MNSDFYDIPITALARGLVGCFFAVDGIGGWIVETEAYHEGDPASHSAAGPTPRNAAMFGPKGHAYVYRSYGLHWCVNIVGGCEVGAAVLIRALEPTTGLDIMARRRGLTDARLFCAGPGRLTQALGITGAMDGKPLDRPPFTLLPRDDEAPVVVGPRVGISRAIGEPWRFGRAGSRFLSRPFPR